MQELPILGYILFFTLIGSVFSLIGGVILLFKEKLALKFSHFLAAFAAGTLLGTVFFDLLPEAIHEAEHLTGEGGSAINVFTYVLFGILGFFLLERFIHWFHHHQHEYLDEEAKPTVSLIIVGDSVHNFIDGVVIAVTFLVSIPLGIITTLAVAAHEIPQEIGDFGILLNKGIKRKKILLLNILSALMAMVGAIIAYLLGERIEAFLPILLSITAGFFIYIAASDLIPEIHHENRKGFAVIETALLFLGVGTVWVFISLLEGVGGH
ncbi:MAG: ZIP family metal transporter [Candidatus Levybacteria bacterium]|nr:ZIP family metal transporter [Candidatus Levybacteria bacterium]MDZ4227639.1 ZIP family metal transporter [Candidatus Levybacteria bacterium]